MFRTTQAQNGRFYLLFHSNVSSNSQMVNNKRWENNEQLLLNSRIENVR